MIDKAIAKINAEMQKDPSDRYLEILGHYIIDRCDENLAAKITGGKTLKGAMELVLKKARNAKKGNVATLTPGEVFGEVDKYFGLPTDDAAQWRAIGLTPAGAPAPVEEQPRYSSKNIDPLDFL